MEKLKKGMKKMQNKKQGEIHITLYSDLCTGNGYSYYGTIDSEAEHDDFGLPFIPARRLKGCLRECAELLRDSGLWGKSNEESGDTEKCTDPLNYLFGISADDGTKGIRIENAYISEYEQIKKDLKLIKENKQIQKYISPDEVLDIFSDVKAQTKMENGVADDNSLRFTRIIHQFSPFNKENRLEFIAKVEYLEGQEDKLKQICKALRHIGMNRNRGLGCVKCEFKAEDEAANIKDENLIAENEADNVKCKIQIAKDMVINENPDQKLNITIFFENLGPMIISGDDKNTTLSYIPGKAVLGALAGTYLSEAGHTADDEEFVRLFLNGDTIYSDFNISDGVHIFDPAPSFLNKMKKSKKYVNSLRYSEKQVSANKDYGTDNKDYDPANGNQPKKLKGKYIYLEINKDNRKLLEYEPKQRIIYHHRRGNDALLYSQTALKEGQIFGGNIICNSKDYKLLLGLLKNTNFSFGKSKTAQYGKCHIIKGSVDELFKKDVKFQVKKDELVYVSLASKGILLDDYGYTQESKKVYQIIGEQLGLLNKEADISEKIGEIQGEEKEYPFCSIQSAMIYGYSSVWNLRKPPIAGIESGSTFIYKAAEDKDIDKYYVGERNLEGFGKVRLYREDVLPYELNIEVKNSNTENNDTKTENIDNTLKKLSEGVKEILKQSLYKVLYQNMLERILTEMANDSFKLRMSPSTIGRVNLMVKETLPKNENKPNDKYKDFVKRVASIKRDTEREEALKIVGRFLGSIPSKENENVDLDIEKMLGESLDQDSNSENSRLYSLLCQLTDEEKVNAHISSLWGELLLELLANQKYLKKFN